MTEDSTQAKILAAARELFCAQGFSGTPIDEIASRAGVDQNQVLQQFETKEKLWSAVKQSIIAAANRRVPILPSTGLVFHEFLRELVENNIKFYRENPDIVRMLNWQRLENKDKKIGVSLTPESQIWIDVISHYQKLGHINPELDAEYVFLFILSVVTFAALDTKTTFLPDDAKEQEYFDFCVERLLQALHSFR